MKETNNEKSSLLTQLHKILTTTITAVLISTFFASSIAGQSCLNNVILDGGFEAGGIPSSIWNPETSTNFGTPLCDVASCGTGGGASPARTGSIWLWLGGIPAPETATIGQTVTIANGATATLTFWMRAGTVSSPFTDVVNVRVDGTIVQSYPEPAVAEGAYTQRTINLNAYANGGSHAILFQYIGATSGTASFVIDDVVLNVCAPTAATASISGRVNTPQEFGLTNATATLTDSDGNARTVLTQKFGSFRFTDVLVGETYVLRVFSKRYTYAPQIITVNGDVTDVNFAPTQ